MAAPLLNGEQVGELLGYTSRTVRSLAARGELPRVVLGPRSTRYRREDVEALIERRTVTLATSEAAPAQDGSAQARAGRPDNEPV